MNQDFKEFFELLNTRRVEYLVIGGVAYNFYAPPRATKDIDVWVRPELANLDRFLGALAEFGFDHDLVSSQLIDDERVVVLGRAPNRIDVLTRPKGIDFDQCWARAIPSTYAGEPVRFLALQDLIQSKRAAARPQDLVDVEKLEAIAARQARD